MPGPSLASPAWLGPAALLVPVKSFGAAKGRLAPALRGPERAELARRMATGVVLAGGDMPVAVVCDDPEVAAWARDLGALVIWEPGRGLNGAVQEGATRLAAAGVEMLAVAHGDLPMATDLRWVVEFPGVTLVPDRRGEGTNVIGLPLPSSFVFSYGPGSFARHRAEALRIGPAVRTVHGSPLAWDVDEPADLIAVMG